VDVALPGVVSSTDAAGPICLARASQAKSLVECLANPVFDPL
jgi:hypothetical protein